MPEIEVDEDVFRLLKKHAEPFTDTPNTVLRRLLELDQQSEAEEEEEEESKVVFPSGVRSRGRASPGSILPESEYEIPILQELAIRGGRGHATEITGAVGERLAPRLTDRDWERMDSGEVRWRNRVHFTRLALKKRGLLASDSPRGIWEITEAGRTVLAEAEEEV